MFSKIFSSNLEKLEKKMNDAVLEKIADSLHLTLKDLKKKMKVDPNFRVEIETLKNSPLFALSTATSLIQQEQQYTHRSLKKC